jgi:hypothetical protein
MIAEESQYQQLIAQRQQIETGISQIDNEIRAVLAQEMFFYLQEMGYQFFPVSQTMIQSSIFLIDVKISAYEVNFLITLSNSQSLPTKTGLPTETMYTKFPTASMSTDMPKEGDAATDNPTLEVTRVEPKPTPTPAVGGKGRNRLSTLFRTRVVWKPMETSFDTFFQSNLTQYFIGGKAIDFPIAEV